MTFPYLQRRDEKLDLIPRQVYECDTKPQPSSHPVSARTESDPRASWASGAFDLRSSNAEPLVPGLFERLPADDRDAIDRRKRLEKRQPAIFTLYPAQDEEDQIERRLIPGLPQEPAGHRILVKVKQEI